MAKNNANPQTNQDIYKKIEYLEENGLFNIDPADDPETIPLQPNKVDYLNKKLSSKISTKIANKVALNFINNLIKDKKMIIKDIIGMENINSIDTGFVMTCNHFNPFDNFALHKVIEQSKHHKNKKFYKVIREGNYTNFGGIYGYFFKHCDTLPLSSIKRTMINFMHAINEILTRGDIVLVYPEQSLWLNYKKPKPLNNGAFVFAINNNVPVLPCFITFEDSDILQEDGEYVQEYTINILPPIYPKKDISKKENVEYMKNLNYELWKNVYEQTYNTKLVYTTKTDIKI